MYSFVAKAFYSIPRRYKLSLKDISVHHRQRKTISFYNVMIHRVKGKNKILIQISSILF
jgi:hypothetical protein